MDLRIRGHRKNHHLLAAVRPAGQGALSEGNIDTVTY